MEPRLFCCKLLVYINWSLLYSFTLDLIPNAEHMQHVNATLKVRSYSAGAAVCSDKQSKFDNYAQCVAKLH